MERLSLEVNQESGSNAWQIPAISVAALDGNPELRTKPNFPKSPVIHLSYTVHEEGHPISPNRVRQLCIMGPTHMHVGNCKMNSFKMPLTSHPDIGLRHDLYTVYRPYIDNLSTVILHYGWFCTFFHLYLGNQDHLL